MTSLPAIAIEVYHARFGPPAMTPDDTWYVVEGVAKSAMPIVLVHGVGLDHSMFDEQVRALKSNYQVIRYDLLGHGRTPALPQRVSLNDFRDQLLSLFDQLRIDKAFLVGFSLGGIIAQRFVADHGHRLCGLVLMSTFYRRTDDELAGVRSRLRITEKEGLDGIVEQAIERWFDRSFQARQPQAVASVRKILSNNDRRGYTDAYRVFAEAEIENGSALLGVNCPTLVITGSDDLGATPVIAQRMVADLNDARLAVLDGFRHMTTIEAPSLINHALSEFFSEVEVTVLPE